MIYNIELTETEAKRREETEKNIREREELHKQFQEIISQREKESTTKLSEEMSGQMNQINELLKQEIGSLKGELEKKQEELDRVRDSEKHAGMYYHTSLSLYLF